MYAMNIDYAFPLKWFLDRSHLSERKRGGGTRVAWPLPRL